MSNETRFNQSKSYKTNSDEMNSIEGIDYRLVRLPLHSTNVSQETHYSHSVNVKEEILDSQQNLKCINSPSQKQLTTTNISLSSYITHHTENLLTSRDKVKVISDNNLSQTITTSPDSSFIDDIYYNLSDLSSDLSDLSFDLSDLSSEFSDLSYTNKTPHEILSQKIFNFRTRKDKSSENRTNKTIKLNEIRHKESKSMKSTKKCNLVEMNDIKGVEYNQQNNCTENNCTKILTNNQHTNVSQEIHYDHSVNVKEEIQESVQNSNCNNSPSKKLLTTTNIHNSKNLPISCVKSEVLLENNLSRSKSSDGIPAKPSLNDSNSSFTFDSTLSTIKTSSTDSIYAHLPSLSSTSTFISHKNKPIHDISLLHKIINVDTSKNKSNETSNSNENNPNVSKPKEAMSDDTNAIKGIDYNQQNNFAINGYYNSTKSAKTSLRSENYIDSSSDRRSFISSSSSTSKTSLFYPDSSYINDTYSDLSSDLSYTNKTLPHKISKERITRNSKSNENKSIVIRSNVPKKTKSGDIHATKEIVYNHQNNDLSSELSENKIANVRRTRKTKSNENKSNETAKSNETRPNNSKSKIAKSGEINTIKKIDYNQQNIGIKPAETSLRSNYIDSSSVCGGRRSPNFLAVSNSPSKPRSFDSDSSYSDDTYSDLTDLSSELSELSNTNETLPHKIANVRITRNSKSNENKSIGTSLNESKSRKTKSDQINSIKEIDCNQQNNSTKPAEANLRLDCKETIETSKSTSQKGENIDVRQIVVPYSKKESKKHFCIFCKTLQCKIARHIFLKHKNVAEVKRASLLPAKSKERLKIIDKLRKQGDFEHNTSVEHNSGVLIVSRRQQNKCKNNVDDYVCCKNCKGFFSKKTIRLHNAVCSTSIRNNFIESRTLTQYIHSVSNNVLKTKIFPVLRNDEITKSIRYDELIIKYGNKLSEKYSSEHLHDMIRSKLRLLGRFIIEVNKLDPNVRELKDIFKSHLFDTCIKAVRSVANWDSTLMSFKTPGVARNLTSLIKKCGKIQRAELIKDKRKNLKAELEKFLLLWGEDIKILISTKAIEGQTKQIRTNKFALPSKEDITKLYLYLKQKIVNAMEKLVGGFCTTSWTQLVQAALVFIQIFNRRRPGEIERLTIENFESKKLIIDGIDQDILKNVSMDAIKIAKQFVKISLRDAFGRTVNVLLCPLCVRAIEEIMKFRLEAGITKENNYIFSRPTNSSFSKPYYRACALLKLFSEKCGAQVPESLRGTALRKNITSYAMLLEIEEAFLDRPADITLNHYDVHKSICKLRIPIAEINSVSKLLMSAAEDDGYVVGDAVYEKADNEEDFGEVANERFCQKSKNFTSTPSRTSHSGKIKRRRWSNSEKEAIFSIFGDLGKLKRLPTLDQCLNAIRQSSALKKRTPPQIKTWIDNQRRYKMDLKYFNEL